MHTYRRTSTKRPACWWLQWVTCRTAALTPNVSLSIFLLGVSAVPAGVDGAAGASSQAGPALPPEGLSDCFPLWAQSHPSCCSSCAAVGTSTAVTQLELEVFVWSFRKLLSFSPVVPIKGIKGVSGPASCRSGGCYGLGPGFCEQVVSVFRLLWGFLLIFQ